MESPRKAITDKEINTKLYWPIFLMLIDVKFIICTSQFQNHLFSPRVYPGHLTGVLLHTVGNLIQNKAATEGFCNSFHIQHVHRIHWSLLLYSVLFEMII